MIGLTRPQWEMLGFIASFVNEHGYSPTYRQMADASGLASTSGVSRIVHALAERGCLTILPGRGRSVYLTKDGADHAAAYLAKLRPRETVAA